jgi:ribonucleoside-diphosphate reductase alpha chain
MEDNYTGSEHTFIYKTLENVKNPAISDSIRYHLKEEIKNELNNLKVPFEDDDYRYSIYLRTYSRLKSDGSRERWPDTVIRVIEGTMTCYINHMNKNNLYVNMDKVDRKAHKMALSLFNLEFSPPGRGLYAMGTEHVYKNGNAALTNCGACETKNLIKALSWSMDNLMLGAGIGFDCSWKGTAIAPNKNDFFIYVIPDTRQGWVSALELLVRAYIPVKGQITNKFPIFDFSLIRKRGTPIKGFGGTASGPEPLIILLNRIEIYFDTYIAYQQARTKEEQADVYENMVRNLVARNAYREIDNLENEIKIVRESVFKYDKPYDNTRLIVDCFNSIGICVVSGNVRRSSLIALGDYGDKTFLDLKNYEVCPERTNISYMSNNTVRIWKNEDFEKALPDIAERIKNNGEPGVANMINCQKYGRIGDKTYGEDLATLLNPCGEVMLESFETCILATPCPYNCRLDLNDPKSPIDEKKVHRATKFATFYATVVTTIRHHWFETNQIIAANRRIGVSFGGVTNISENYGTTKLIKYCRDMYFLIRKYNAQLTSKLGIPRSIRVTTCKPEGSLSGIMGVCAGVHFPICEFGERRVIFDKDDPLVSLLRAANYQIEPSAYGQENVAVVVFPIKSNGVKAAKKVSIYKKFSIATLMQRHFADNSVSFTGDFSFEKEGEEVESVLSCNVSSFKSVSMLPHFESHQVYKQLPFTEITEEEYWSLVKRIGEVQWDNFFLNKKIKDLPRDAVIYCTDEGCTIIRPSSSSSSSSSS